MANIYGTSNSDVLVDTPEKPEFDRIFGYEGDDKIYSASGSDIVGQGDLILAGSGADEVRVKLQDELGVYPVQVEGGAGNDFIAIEGTGAGTLSGKGSTSINSEDNDTINLFGGGGVPPVGANPEPFYFKTFGNEGNDVIRIYGGWHEINVGTGDDQVFIGRQYGDDRQPYFGTQRLFGVAYIIDEGGNDTYTLAPNVVLPDNVSDVTIQELPNGGFDTLISFSNTNRLSIPDNIEAVYVKEITPFQGKATVIGTAQGNDIYAQDAVPKADGQLEILAGAGDDNIFGSQSSQGDLLFGENGDDYLNGFGGNDVINGGNDSDYLYGGDGNDTLIGGTGSDVLVGEVGQDTLTGGAGTDSFGFTSPGDGVDRITDFNSIDDRINIYSYNFPVSGFIGQSGTALPTNMFRLGSSALDGDDRFVYDRSRGELFFDQDGSGAANQVLIATFANNPVIAANDIVIF
ncbi:hypothetical protein C7B80_22450 [Cyanosarcina cf. burmensis CCALA 770]|nr:hypothetical protein C7B80_22450 [Cyanosarcina cf. burmensis CCALA 770]